MSHRLPLHQKRGQEINKKEDMMYDMPSKFLRTVILPYDFNLVKKVQKSLKKVSAILIFDIVTRLLHNDILLHKNAKYLQLAFQLYFYFA